MTTPVFANSAAVQPAQGGEVACASIAGGPFAAIDAYVSGGTPGVQLEFRLYATVGTLRTRVAVAPYAGPPVGAAGQGTLLKWTVIGQPQATSPVVAGGTVYDLVVYGVTGAGTAILATLAGTNAFDAAVARSAAVALPSNYGSTSIVTNVGCAQLADVGVDQAGLPSNVTFDVFASCGAGSIEALVGTGGSGGTDGKSDVVRDLQLPVATQYRLAVRETQGQKLSGNVTAALATYSSVIPGAATGALNGDVHGPSTANLIHNFQELKKTTLEFAGGGTGVPAADQAAYTASLAAMNAGTYGGLKLGDKTYSLSAGGTLPANATIEGGGDVSEIDVTGNVTGILVGGDNTTIKDLKLKGTGAGATQFGIGNADLAGGAGFSTGRVLNVTMDSFGEAGVLLFNSASVQRIGPTFIGCKIVNNPTFGFWCLTEYTSLIASTVNNNGEGVRLQGGNILVDGCVITLNTLGVHVTSGGNDGHGMVIGCLINHNATNIKVDDGLINGMPFIGNNIYGVGTSTIIGANCKGLRFVGNALDQAEMTIGTNSVVGFWAGLWPQGFANAFTIDPTAKVTFGPDNVDLNGEFPTCIINGAQSGLRWPKKVTGTAAAAGGTAVFTFTKAIDFADNAVVRVKAHVYMTQGTAPLGKTAGLYAEAGVTCKAGTTAFPAAIAGSVNPMNSGGALAAAPEWCDFGNAGVVSTAIWTVSGAGGTIILTVTNLDPATAADITVDLDWEQAHS